MDENNRVSNRVIGWIIMEKNYVANGVWRSATSFFSLCGVRYIQPVYKLQCTSVHLIYVWSRRINYYMQSIIPYFKTIYLAK